MEFSIESITPQIAKELLQNNFGNRPISQMWVARHAATMNAGLWRLTGQPILISETGRLLDGQHRLAAVVKSGKTIEIAVTRGVKDNVFPAIDDGMPRQAAHSFATAGFKDTKAIAAASKYILNYIEKRNVRYEPARSIVVAFGRQLIDLDKWVSLSVSTGKSVSSHPMLAAVLYMGTRNNKYVEEAREFILGLKTGENLSKGDPRLTLREWNFQQKWKLYSRNKLETYFFATCKCWNAFALGTELFVIRIPDSVEVSSIVGLPKDYAWKPAASDQSS